MTEAIEEVLSDEANEKQYNWGKELVSTLKIKVANNA